MDSGTAWNPSQSGSGGWDGKFAKPRACAAGSLGVKMTVPFRRTAQRSWRLLLGRTIQVLVLSLTLSASAGDLGGAIRLHLRGDYTNCLRACEQALEEGSPSEQWHHWQVRSQLALGRYPEALTNVLTALAEHRASLRLRLLAHEVLTANGDLDRARGLLLDANELGGARWRNYQDAPNRVALGQAALLLGAEPKRVLELCFEPAKQADPELREAPLAIGQLALDKHDFALAAKTFAEALKKFPEDADFHFGLARAYAPSARGQALESLETALRFNPNHVPALVLGADLAIDAEDYAAAEKALERALTVNPWHPEAWAYRAVLRHLENQPDAEAQARGRALRFWPTNPKVGHLIGRKLSQKYRFAEGAALQRFLRGHVVFRVNRQVRPQHQGGNVIRIEPERGVQRFQRLAARAGRVGLGQAEMEVGVFRELLQRLGERLRRQRKVMLVQSQLPDRQRRFAQLRIRLFRRLEAELEDALGLGPQQQRRLAEGNPVRRVLVVAPAGAAQFIHVQQQAAGAIDLAVGGEHLVGQQAQTEAGPVFRQGG